MLRHTLRGLSSGLLARRRDPEARMSASGYTGGRLRAYLQFLAAILYFFLARSLAFHGAQGLGRRCLVSARRSGHAGVSASRRVMPPWVSGSTAKPSPSASRDCRAAKAGRAKWGWAWQSAGERRWSASCLCWLPAASPSLSSRRAHPGAGSSPTRHSFAVAALAEEIAYRGYAFQCFIRAVGPAGAALGFAAIYAIVQALDPGANRASLIVSLAFSFLLSTAYLRTRALWVSWGLNFGWKASQALVFGLAVSGVSSHSPVVQGDPMGPFWLTGGAFGLDGSWLPFVRSSRCHPGGLSRHARSRFPL